MEPPFGFACPTERAFAAAEFTPSSGQTFKNCWSVRAQKPVDSEISEMEAADPDATVGEEGCPDLR